MLLGACTWATRRSMWRALRKREEDVRSARLAQLCESLIRFLKPEAACTEHEAVRTEEDRIVVQSRGWERPLFRFTWTWQRRRLPKGRAAPSKTVMCSPQYTFLEPSLVRCRLRRACVWSNRAVSICCFSFRPCTAHSCNVSQRTTRILLVSLSRIWPSVVWPPRPTPSPPLYHSPDAGCWRNVQTGSGLQVVGNP